MRIAQENVLQSGILGQMEGGDGVPLRPTETVLAEVMGSPGWVLIMEIKASIAMNEVGNLARKHVFFKGFPKAGMVLSMRETSDHHFRQLWLDSCPIT